MIFFIGLVFILTFAHVIAFCRAASDYGVKAGNPFRN